MPPLQGRGLPRRTAVFVSMSRATAATSSSSGSEPVFVNELVSPIVTGIACHRRTGAVSVPTFTVPLPAST